MFPYYDLVPMCCLQNIEDISYTIVHSFYKLLRYKNHSNLKNNTDNNGIST